MNDKSVRLSLLDLLIAVEKPVICYRPYVIDISSFDDTPGISLLSKHHVLEYIPYEGTITTKA